jgi:predicted transcriptional regulator
VTIGLVPNQPRTPNRTFRLSDDDWDDLADLADSLDRDRAWIIRQLVRWYLRRPGAELPERPQS